MSDSTSGSALRIIDANANRAREALRVMEDYSRFSLNAQSLSADLKALRHELTAALEPLLPVAVLHRDTDGDVGTGNKTASELSRDSTAHVVIAAGKRLGEALRCLEEFAKTVEPAIASRIERVRYRFYVLEQTAALTLRPGRFANVRLYVLISAEHCGANSWLQAAEQAIAGGADCLQLREKNLEAGELLKRAREFVKLCRSGNVISIVNDRADVAMAADADGVHVGRTDLPARAARRIVGPDKFVGVSTHCIDHARQAVLDGADYIGVGPIYPSSTKARDFVAGLEYARQVAGEIRLPAMAISGINIGNVDAVMSSGIRAIAVTAAVTEQPDIAAAARALKDRLTRQHA